MTATRSTQPTDAGVSIMLTCPHYSVSVRVEALPVPQWAKYRRQFQYIWKSTTTCGCNPNLPEASPEAP